MRSEVAERLQRADGFICVAGDLLRLGHWSDAVSRSYYAMFHAATGVLLELDIERSSHHAVWAAFGEFVTARGLMDARHHHAGLRWFRARNDSDYFTVPADTREKAEEAVAAARDFVAACRSFLDSRQ